MNETRLVCVVQAERRLPRVLARLGDRERPVLLDQAREVDPVHELHREVIPAVDFAGVEDGDDVRVLQASATSRPRGA